MHKINRVGRHEKDVYRQFLSKPWNWHQNLRCIDRPFSHWLWRRILHHVMYIFIDTYHFQGRWQAQKTHQKFFSCLFIWWHKIKVAVRFEGNDRPPTQLSEHSLTYTVTLCQYLDPENELPIDPSTRFLCVAHAVWDHEILQNEKYLKHYPKKAPQCPTLLG